MLLAVAAPFSFFFLRIDLVVSFLSLSATLTSTFLDFLAGESLAAVAVDSVSHVKMRDNEIVAYN